METPEFTLIKTPLEYATLQYDIALVRKYVALFALVMLEKTDALLNGATSLCPWGGEKKKIDWIFCSGLKQGAAGHW